MRAAYLLAVGVATRCHVVPSAWAGTGAGAAATPHVEPVVLAAWRWVPHGTFTVVADAGNDAEANHELARRDMLLKAVVHDLMGLRPTVEIKQASRISFWRSPPRDCGGLTTRRHGWALPVLRVTLTKMRQRQERKR